VLNLLSVLGVLGVGCEAPSRPDVLDVPNAVDSSDVLSTDMMTADRAAQDDVPSMDADSAQDVQADDRPTMVDVPMTSDASAVDRDFCTAGMAVPGLTVPAGFCVRKYASMRVARVLAVAPNGDLFVAAPVRVNATGLGGGPGSIFVLRTMPDNTVQESVFATGLSDVHGMVFGGGYLWFTNDATVFRTPYTNGQLAENVAMREVVIGNGEAASMRLGSGGRATHGLSRSVTGRMLVTRGEYSQCVLGAGGVRGVATGEIYSLGMHSLTRVAYGFRNPMYTRCHFGRELCMAAELGEDQTTGATEKLLVIPSEESWYGYPCCYNRTAGPRFMSGDCATVTQEQVSVQLGDTPFGFDWERGRWPAPYRNAVFVALHGSFYLPDFAGAAVSFLPTDPDTAVPQRMAPMPFLRGTTGSAQVSLQRPADVVFSPDGRMFIADDYGGGVYVVSPRVM
jgi:glucose/arabinose dehydrogenase